ncbi:MAG: diacylglycerol kinase family protein [Candidatus Saccharibacteria bacterium]
MVRTNRSFRYAFRGLKMVISRGRNARIHVVAAVLALATSIILQISWYDSR